jgi:leucyl/phenylalanyl-tRNA--protein transferase
MPIYQLHPSKIWFPPPSQFEADQDVIAVGGAIEPNYLMAAYQHGAFPWFNPGEPILWWHPRKRMVLEPQEVKIRKSTRNLWNQKRFTFTINKAFADVIEQCQTIKRPGQEGGTWLSDTLKNSFINLHQRGYALSVEAWRDGQLVGGLYGFKNGAIFSGDSMFSKESNASKLAFIFMCKTFAQAGFKLIDCQIHNPYLESLGAYEISRQAFLEKLEQYRPLNVNIA